MKRIISILMILCLALSVTGCAELVSTEEKEVKVVIGGTVLMTNNELILLQHLPLDVKIAKTKL